MWEPYYRDLGENETGGWDACVINRDFRILRSIVELGWGRAQLPKMRTWVTVPDECYVMKLPSNSPSSLLLMTCHITKFMM
jgi:hypothetical protein